MILDNALSMKMYIHVVIVSTALHIKLQIIGVITLRTMSTSSPLPEPLVARLIAWELCTYVCTNMSYISYICTNVLLCTNFIWLHTIYISNSPLAVFLSLNIHVYWRSLIHMCHDNICVNPGKANNNMISVNPAFVRKSAYQHSMTLQTLSQAAS